jgi:hypothetical protein
VHITAKDGGGRHVCAVIDHGPAPAVLEGRHGDPSRCGAHSDPIRRPACSDHTPTASGLLPLARASAPWRSPQGDPLQDADQLRRRGTGLRAARPDLAVAVVEAEPPELFTRLDAGEVDVAVAVDFAAAPPRTDPRCRRTSVLVDVLDLALPASHSAAVAEQVRLVELAEEAWVVGRAASCCGAVTRSVCAAAGFTPESRHFRRRLGRRCRAGGRRRRRCSHPPPRPAPPPGLVLRPVAGAPLARHAFAAVRAGSQGRPRALNSVLTHLQAAAAQLDQPHAPVGIA